jgi:hypothetical protein
MTDLELLEAIVAVMKLEVGVCVCVTELQTDLQTELRIELQTDL